MSHWAIVICIYFGITLLTWGIVELLNRLRGRDFKKEMSSYDAALQKLGFQWRGYTLHGMVHGYPVSILPSRRSYRTGIAIVGWFRGKPQHFDQVAHDQVISYNWDLLPQRSHISLGEDNLVIWLWWGRLPSFTTLDEAIHMAGRILADQKFIPAACAGDYP
jgi:hypothetical protein